VTESFILLMALAAGLLIGAIFFGGLKWTVRKSLASKYPGLWVFGSLMLRMSTTMTGFYFFGRTHWQSLLMCLLGFVIARHFVIRLTRPPVGQHAPLSQQAGHAP
jgi:F1F0 ATPase subunit 2